MTAVSPPPRSFISGALTQSSPRLLPSRPLPFESRSSESLFLSSRAVHASVCPCVTYTGIRRSSVGGWLGRSLLILGKSCISFPFLPFLNNKYSQPRRVREEDQDTAGIKATTRIWVHLGGYPPSTLEGTLQAPWRVLWRTLEGIDPRIHQKR